MFQVSEAKREVLRSLAERDWSPTDLAEELGKSPETVYNHLHDLEEMGLLETRTVAVKTRPKTEYSIGNGLIQYITLLPGQFREGTLNIDETKEVMFRIWALPQAELHVYLERFMWSMWTSDAIDHVTAVGVYGSVARGEADDDSDIDLLVVTPTDDGQSAVEDGYGSTILEFGGTSRVGMAEVFTEEEFRNSLTHGSDFLTTVLEEIHPIYDPEGLLIEPERGIHREG